MKLLILILFALILSYIFEVVRPVGMFPIGSTMIPTPISSHTGGRSPGSSAEAFVLLRRDSIESPSRKKINTTIPEVIFCDYGMLPEYLVKGSFHFDFKGRDPLLCWGFTLGEVQTWSYRSTQNDRLGYGCFSLRLILAERDPRPSSFESNPSRHQRGFLRHNLMMTGISGDLQPRRELTKFPVDRHIAQTDNLGSSLSMKGDSREGKQSRIRRDSFCSTQPKNDV